MSDELLEGKTVGQLLVEGFEGMAKSLKEENESTLLASAIEAARAMGTRRLTRTSLLRMADAYMAYLAEMEAIKQAESLPVYDGPAEEVPRVDDDLKAAVSRLEESDLIATVERNRKKWETWFPNPETGVDVPRADVEALMTIAKAFLARLAEEEQREDDGPVQNTTLEELGFVFAFGAWDKVIAGENGFHHIIRFTTHTVEPHWELGGGNEHIMTFTPLLAPTTRQLRRLISALEG